jgi:hypothetical protein
MRKFADTLASRMVPRGFLRVAILETELTQEKRLLASVAAVGSWRSVPRWSSASRGPCT